MTKPVRIQLSRRKGWRMPENTVKVDRTTKWGNPFIVSLHGKAVDCVKWFCLMLAGFFICDRRIELDDMRVYRKHARQNLWRLRGKNLGCWCRLCAAHKDGKPFDEDCPDVAPSHADPLSQLANRRNGSRKPGFRQGSGGVR